DVGPDLDFIGADLFAVAEEFGGAGVDEAFIGDVGKGEAFDANPIEVGGMGDGEGFAIGGGENLDADGAAKFSFHGLANDGHGGNDFRSDGAAEVGDIVHVFQGDTVDAGVAVDTGFVDGGGDNFTEGELAGGGAGQSADVNHADDRFGGGEESRFHGADFIGAVGIGKVRSAEFGVRKWGRTIPHAGLNSELGVVLKVRGLAARRPQSRHVQPGVCGAGPAGVFGLLHAVDPKPVRGGHAAENLATLRRWALNLIKRDQQKQRRSLKGRMKAAGWDNRYLLHLLGLDLNA
ncbi:MAG: Transposase family protein, partial [Pedosphaera sp.]|nr:Transposase family protein [Pedosphaera sp.]